VKVVAIVNQKGGVGKSTTAAALAGGLFLKGLRVLSIDLDAQGNLSHTMRAGPGKGKSVLSVLLQEATIQEAVQSTPWGGLLPASRSLSGVDAILVDTGKEYRLREALELVQGEYDYVIIDSPPALGIATVNALTAAHTAIIPAQADIYSLQGIEQLAGTIRTVKRYCNPGLSIDGILLTRYSPRSILSREVQGLMEQLAGKLDTRLYQTAIREAIAVKEAQISRQSLLEYAPHAKVTEDYRALLQEAFPEV
jgi:chromosome partitioning protein